MRKFALSALARKIVYLSLLFMGRAATAADDVIELQIGDPAPTFDALDDQGQPWKSTQHVGMQYLVVYFYPGDFKFCATRQAEKYQRRIDELAARNTVVVGISGDASQTHCLFKGMHDLGFTLLSDEDGRVAKQFGVPVRAGSARPICNKEGRVIGTARRGVTAARWTFIIGRDGTILYKNTSVSPIQDSADVLQFIDALATRR